MNASGTLRTQVIEDPAALDALAAPWDRLAVACSRPYCAPAWLAAWWRHVAGRPARLRLVVVRDGADVIGIAPCFMTIGRLGVRTLRPLGCAVSHGLEPLAVPGREVAVARAMAETLAGAPASPDVIAFDGVEGGSRWPGDLARVWPHGPAAMLTRYELPSVALSLREYPDYGAWFAGKSRNFRHSLRKRQNRFARAGGRVRMATAATLEADLRALVRLHRARWDPRGGSAFISDAVEQMLMEAAPTLLTAGRLRLWSLDVSGDVISSHLALTAGSDYAYWLTGFDERHGAVSPSLLGTLAIVEDAFATGAGRVDFAGGDTHWKTRFADVEGTLAWRRVVPRGPRHARSRLVLAAGQWRRAVAERVPEDARARVVGVERRLRSAAAGRAAPGARAGAPEKRSGGRRVSGAR
jgi:CelD/BcsL family acetyltransferase involved in cellulose biosynthesis